jgi:AcrR family transcriptional regulator
LAAARDVFLKEGYAASTRTIARAARVSEATLFKRFDTKERLFRASMGTPTEIYWLDNLLQANRDLPLRERLLAAGLEALTFYRTLVPRLMAAWPGPPGGGRDPKGPSPTQAMRRFGAFLESEQKDGRLGACTPALMARLFIAGLWHYVTLETIGFDRELLGDAAAYVEGMVDHLLGAWALPSPVTPQ